MAIRPKETGQTLNGEILNWPTVLFSFTAENSIVSQPLGVLLWACIQMQAGQLKLSMKVDLGKGCNVLEQLFVWTHLRPLQHITVSQILH